MDLLGRLATARPASRTIQAKGLSLHLVEWGWRGNPPLVLLHGNSAHARWWDLLALALEGEYHLVALDQRGHGESGWPRPPAYRTEDFVEDLLVLLDTLELGKVTLIGHSMGSHNAMSFAGLFPQRLQALLLVDGRPATPPERIQAMRRRGRRPRYEFPTREAALAAFRLMPTESVAPPALLHHIACHGVIQLGNGRWAYKFDRACDATRIPMDAWPLLPKIGCHTLVVRGEWSPILPRDVAEAMVTAIPGSRMAEIKGAHHHVFLDQPQAFEAVVRQFLAGQGCYEAVG